MVSCQPLCSGEGRAPPADSTVNCTPWMWKLCGWSPRLVTSQISAELAAAAKSIRPMSICLPLMACPARSYWRVVAAQGGEGGWHGRGGGEVAGGAQLQDVEAVVAADEQVGQEPGSQVRRVAAEHEALAGAHRHDDLGPVAGRH